jgi:hypothetical protein
MATTPTNANARKGPVQVVLDSQKYVMAYDRPHGGSNKDFFKDNDKEFIKHRDQLASSLEHIERSMRRSKANLSFVKVRLRNDALAKSHRPVRALFNPARVRNVGGAKIGEMLFEVTPTILNEVSADIARAEERVQIRRLGKKKILTPVPSVYRSETGAVEEISEWSSKDRLLTNLRMALDQFKHFPASGYYVVELFEFPARKADPDIDQTKLPVFDSFLQALLDLGPGVDVRRLALPGDPKPLFGIWLYKSSKPASVTLEAKPLTPRASRAEGVPELNLDPGLHTRLLDGLAKHPLVKYIMRAPVLVERGSQAPSPSLTRPAIAIPVRTPDAPYPIIGVVDGGIGSCLGPWVDDTYGFINAKHVSLDHGTYIAGLAVGAQAFNSPAVGPEADGCRLVDVQLIPDEAAQQLYYSGGMAQLFQTLELAVMAMRDSTGVRIFNVSWNLVCDPTPAHYRLAAEFLDNIADRHDAIFVISAGNIEEPDVRPEWSNDQAAVHAFLSAAKNGLIRCPAESLRNLSVGALNAPEHPATVPYAPTAYTRHGPGLSSSVKPDLAHIGGSAKLDATVGHGLWSLTPAGGQVSEPGTSYSAPLVARTLASIAHQIEGSISRETLMGLAIHHAKIPPPVSSPGFLGWARKLVGFGLPPGSDDILAGHDSQVTLVFSGHITHQRRLEFPFTWPRSLTSRDGACRGKVRATLVSSPPLDPAAGDELVRVSLEALIQQQVDDSDDADWTGRVPPIHSRAAQAGGDESESYVYEQERIEASLKWSPVKIYETLRPRGVGKSSNWRILIQAVSRDGSFPPRGVPFSLIVTISDPAGAAPVFNEIRNSLQVSGVRISDIKVAARVTTRI